MENYIYINNSNRIKILGEGEVFWVQFNPHLFRLKIFNWVDAWTTRWGKETLRDSNGSEHEVDIRIEFRDKDEAIEWTKNNLI